MNLLLFLPFLGLSDTDFYGVNYEDNERTILKKAPANLKEYEIPSTTKIIRGGKIDYGPFYDCINVLKNLTFAENSKLVTIEPYGLAYLNVEIIDLSSCTELKELGYSAFRSCKLKTIILPPNLVKIKSGALFSIQDIVSIKFPESLEIIEGYDKEHQGAIGLCKSLSKIYWGENPKIHTLGSDCFPNTAIEEFRIPKSLQTIASGSCFTGCPITHFDIDKDNNFFSSERGVLFDKNKTKLIFCSVTMSGNYTIPNTVNEIYGAAFRSSKLNNIVIPESVTNIRLQAFILCSFEYIYIPSNVQYINRQCFRQCTKLKKIDFYASITNLDEGVFYDCSLLEEIILPDSVRTISSDAFKNCKSIKLISIPGSVTKLEKSIFEGINDEAQIEFRNGSPFVHNGSYIYSNDYTRLVTHLGSGSNFDALIIKEVEVIGGSAFFGKDIQSIVFESGSKLREIEDSAFEGCSKISTVTLPSSTEIIGPFAFKKSGLTEVQFNEEVKLKYINESAFMGTKLKTFSFPSELLSVGASAFQDCIYLGSVRFLGSKVESIGESCFSKTKLTSIVIPSSISSIGENAFAFSSLTMVTFSYKAMRVIGASAFADCQSLTNVVLEEGTEELGRNVFARCTSLSQIEICNTIKTIGQGAFDSCTSLYKISVREGSALEAIDPLAFSGCSHLSQFFIPEDNTNFKSEDGLVTDYDKTNILLHLPGYNKSVRVIPKSVKIVSAHAFQGAFYLQSVSFEECTDVEINFQSFYGCSLLSKIFLGDSISSIASNAFGSCPMIACGSIIHDVSLRPALAASGLREEVYLPCQTVHFTAGLLSGPSQAVAFHSLVIFGEKETED